MFFRILSVLPVLLVVSVSAQAQQFTNLLAGDDLAHWMKPGGAQVSGGWLLEPDGVLHLSGKGGNILTRELYEDFELWFEFKVATKGNNGLKYRVKQYGKSWLGLEYQCLDDASYPKLTRDHLTGSLYDLVNPIPNMTRLRPHGEYNVGKIRVHNNRVQHWVNGQLMINTPLSGPAWKTHVAASKFNKHDGFGENALGHIMLTDHRTEAWYRNMFIRRLNSASPCCQICPQRSESR